MKKNLIYTAILVALTTPLVASAATGEAFSNLTTIINQIGSIIKILVPIVFLLGILAFFWGLVKYIFAQGSEDGKKDAKNIMLWSLVALFVMSSVFGIIRLAQGTLGITNTSGDSVNVPTVHVTN